jgi:hypothetical protein
VLPAPSTETPTGAVASYVAAFNAHLFERDAADFAQDYWELVEPSGVSNSGRTRVVLRLNNAVLSGAQQISLTASPAVKYVTKDLAIVIATSKAAHDPAAGELERITFFVRKEDERWLLWRTHVTTVCAAEDDETPRSAHETLPPARDIGRSPKSDDLYERVGETVDWYFNLAASQAFDDVDEVTTKSFDLIDASGRWTRGRADAVNLLKQTFMARSADVTLREQQHGVVFPTRDISLVTDTVMLGPFSEAATRPMNQKRQTTILVVNHGGHWLIEHLQSNLATAPSPSDLDRREPAWRDDSGSRCARVAAGEAALGSQ